MEVLSRQQKTLATLAEFFLRNEKTERLYGTLSELIREVLQVDGCLILENPPETDSWQLFSACGFCDLNQLESTNWIENEQLQATLEQTGVIAVADYETSTRFSPLDRKCFREFRSGMSIRIHGESQSRGILAVYDRSPREFKRQEIDFLKTISDMLAGALSRAAKDRELKKSEARAKAILDTAVDGIITTDERGRITLVNQATLEIFGYRQEEMIGNSINMLMPDDYSREHDRHMSRYQSTGIKKIIGSGREVAGIRKDGSTFPLYLAVSEFYTDGHRQFTGIVRDITDQRRLEQEVLKTSDHERRRIGQDLHDGLGQMLTGIGLMSRSLITTLQKENSSAIRQAEEITQLIREADEYARNLSRGLLPVDFEVRGLVTSLERLAANAERLFGIKCTFRESTPPVFHENSVVEHLFRIAQEAISNAVKHGLADTVSLELESNEEYATLRVTDNGKGFSDDWRRKKGSGLDIMQFRAQLIGAKLEVQSRSDGGVTLICMLSRSVSMYQFDTELR
ncbi:PAS domain S-box protein [Balneolales bacterium ANBcel1]|nr:PAS domain S-box protein [Balneolales bacterium ANBcel1]